MKTKGVFLTYIVRHETTVITANTSSSVLKNITQIVSNL